MFEKKEASNTFRHPTIRIASVEELTLFEKSNLLICEERLERLNHFWNVCEEKNAELVAELEPTKRRILNHG